jgi:putative ABC transport system permease protein
MTMLQIKPILAALKRHKAGTILIALQIALTLAIVCNALFIIQQRLDRIARPTGLTEENLLTIQNRWVGVDDEKTGPLVRADVQAIRALPGVEDAISINSYPLRGGGWSTGVRTNPDAKKSETHTTQYFVDDHALATMGVKLVAGRNFRSDEIKEIDPKAVVSAPQIIVTKTLADKLFPDGSGLGKVVYVDDGTNPSTIIGIVERLEVPWNSSWSDTFLDNAVLEPYQLTGGGTPT